ncbi:hypothetical protein [Deinococcus alpinitundrae]|uniref:hypothetical protein n=1 Tax=Deinococcus alpinitundrae TaxID=468913 RepID=UPI00137B13C5|nr:hypothetical protein [Deinococcus alpinitundrae]
MMDSHEARFEAACQKMARYHREAEIARQFPHPPGLWNPSLWIWAGLGLLKFTRRLEAWLTRHLPLDGELALQALPRQKIQKSRL